VVPWNETISLRGGVRIGGGIEAQDWVATEQALAGGVRVGGRIEAIDVMVNLAAAAITTSPQGVDYEVGPPVVVNLGPAVITTSPQTLSYEITSGSGLTQISSRAALAGNDYLDWGQLGAESYDGVTQPISATTNLSESVTVTADGDLFRFDEAGQWDGNFADGDALLLQDGLGENIPYPITLEFAAAITAVGAQIQNNLWGSFTAKIEVFNGTTSLGAYTASGSSSATTPPAAVFIGLRSSSANITKAQISVTATPDDLLGQFAINRVELET
jgi:hypothetical protein